MHVLVFVAHHQLAYVILGQVEQLNLKVAKYKITHLSSSQKRIN